MDERPFAAPGDAPLDYDRDLGDPGSFPFTRGIHRDMYAGRPWTIRQYAGFGTAAETNRRFRFLIDQGRRKFVRPIYQELMAQGDWGRPLAVRIYRQARPGYHPVTAQAVDAVVK